jgi:hypothetical protein
MKAGKYSVRELFVNSYIDQIIIPEIQRDYVWGEEQIIGLLESVLEDYNKYKNGEVPLESNDLEIKALFKDFYKKQKYSSNIGFLYAYNDPEYVGKYFLIDGQQRITTVYLLLLALSMNSDKSIFEKYYYTEEILKVDYRVRDAAHQFMSEFVKHILSGGKYAAEEIKQQYWYFSSNDLDPTINAIIGNYNHINRFLKENDLYNVDFLNYVQHFIEFWYFDTNLSDQGEELYIYMNARGEQIQPNENLKADLLGSLKDENINEVEFREDYKEDKNLNGLKNYWGKKWEEWQDFFWQRKDKNENADTGFNEFIACIAGLEFYKKKFIDKDFSNAKFSELLSLPSIESQIKTLEYLENNKEEFKGQYNYSGWVDKYHTLIWSYLNKTIKRSANWFADFKDQNKNDDRNNMILLWSLFYYPQLKEANINPDEFFRVMRFFYIRYNNYNRSVPTLENTLNLIIVNGVIDKFDNELSVLDENPEEETDTKFRTADESEKYKFLSGNISDVDLLKKYESLIWEIEDHKYNLDGSYLKNLNITHLIDFNSNPTLGDLQKVKDRFYLLMNFGEGYSEETLVTLLLHYGVYWHQVSPFYYYNYKFNDWRRIIRNIDGDKNAFKLFFGYFLTLENPLTLDDILKRKNIEYLKNNIENIFSEKEFGKRLIVYSILLNNIWYNGLHMCYEGIEDSKLFDLEPSIFNTDRYKGTHWYLWEECKKEYADRAAIKLYLENKIK